MMKSATGLLVTVLLAGLAARDAAAADQAIVAVFNIEAKAGALDAETVATLTDFLNARVAASGRFRTVPRAQIKSRLTALKLRSYKACYDQACQIEIGRELAANKALSTRALRVGDRCMLTFELYDLASAATDAAHTTESDCGEAALLTAVSSGVRELVSKVGAASAATAPATSERPQVSLYVESTPEGADVLVDGLHRGKTPMRLAVERGRPHQLTLLRDGYHQLRRRVIAHDATRLSLPLRLTDAGRRDLAATSEWFGLGFGPCYLAGTDGTSLAVTVRLGSIKWYRFFWTLLDFTGSIPLSQGQAGETDGMMSIGTRAGFPLYLGRRGQHQLLFGLGVAWAVLMEATSTTESGSSSSSSSDGFLSLSPGLDYTYNLLDGAFPIGLGVRLHLPVAGDVDLGGTYPMTLAATINVGFSLYRLLVKGVKEARKRQGATGSQ